MSEENEELNQEEEVSLNITPELNPNQVIDTLADGTEILRDELEEEEEITDDNLRKLVEFTTGEKNLSDERLEALRKNDTELERLIRISMAKSSHLNYRPKKNFGVSYKKNRQRKNSAVKRSRALNR